MLRNVSSSGKSLIGYLHINRITRLIRSTLMMITLQQIQVRWIQIEDILFNCFFAERHLVEKSPDFDDVFYDHVNKICNAILKADAEHDKGQQQFLFEESNNILSSEISTGEILYFKKYETSDKNFDNHGFHPIILRHLGVRAVELIRTLQLMPIRR